MNNLLKLNTVIVTSIITVLLMIFILSGNPERTTKSYTFADNSITDQSIKMKYPHLVVKEIELPKKRVYAKRDLKCLAMNIYYEARNQSVVGQHAVAGVTLNRVKHKKWPNNVCGVVYQRMQFSWTIKGRHYRPKDRLAWKRAKAIAFDTLEDDGKEDLSGGALFYHADYVNPRWNRNMVKLSQIETHIFYTHEVN